VLALALSLVLSAGLAACTGGGEASAPDAASAASSAPVASATDGPPEAVSAPPTGPVLHSEGDGNGTTMITCLDPATGEAIDPSACEGVGSGPGNVITAEAPADETIDPVTGETVPGPALLLGRGTGAPLATGQKAPGLTWADGSPVLLDVLALAGARQVTPVELEDYTPDPGVDNFATAGWSAGRLVGIVSPAMAYQDDGTINPDAGPSYIGYQEGDRWHRGPRVAQHLGEGGVGAFTLGGDTAAWVEQPILPDSNGKNGKWELFLWKVGSPKVTTVRLPAGTDLNNAPQGIAVSGRRVWWDATRKGQPVAVFSANLAGGDAVQEAAWGMRPRAAGTGVVYEGWSDVPDAEVLGGAAFTEVMHVDHGGKPRALLHIAASETTRLLSDIQAWDENTGTSEDRPRPTPPMLASADADTIVLRQRGQLIFLRPGSSTGARVLPLVRPGQGSMGMAGYEPAAACPGGVAFVAQASPEQEPLTWWWSATTGRLSWIDGVRGYGVPECTGGAVVRWGFNTDPSSSTVSVFSPPE